MLNTCPKQAIIPPHSPVTSPISTFLMPINTFINTNVNNVNQYF